MSDGEVGGSARRHELLEAAYGYVLERGLADLSLRPLATAIGSSPRVLLFLFGSKDGLVRALLARARADELDVLDRVRQAGTAGGPRAAADAIWAWLAAPGAPRAADPLARGLRPCARRARRCVGGLRRPDRPRLARASRRGGRGGGRRRPARCCWRCCGVPARPARDRRRRPRRARRSTGTCARAPRTVTTPAAAPRANGKRRDPVGALP